MARDTAIPKRQGIINAFSRVGDVCLNISDLAGLSRLHYRTVKNECEVMAVLGILEEDAQGNYSVRDSFKPYLRAVYTLPEASEKKAEYGSFFEGTGRSM